MTITIITMTGSDWPIRFDYCGYWTHRAASGLWKGHYVIPAWQPLVRHTPKARVPGPGQPAD